MRIAIDASAVSDSGGLTYVYELILNYYRSNNDKIEIEVWGNKNTLNFIPERSYIKKIDISKYSKNGFKRLIWQTFFLKKILIKKDINILYCLSAFYLGGFRPYLLIHQNSLPFTEVEMKKYQFSFKYLKYFIQKKLTLYAYSKSINVICLTKFAQKNILSFNNKINTKIISHGLSKTFIRKPKENNFLKKEYNNTVKIRFLYVSNFHLYKNHLVILKAFKILSKKYNLELNLIGKKSDNSLIKVKNFIKKNKLSNINIISYVNYDEIIKFYINTDFCIYPSTCENFPYGILEAIGLSIPTLASNYICNLDTTFHNIYSFDPNNIDDVINKIDHFLQNKELRYQKTAELYNMILKLDSNTTSNKTIDLITNSYFEHTNSKK